MIDRVDSSKPAAKILFRHAGIATSNSAGCPAYSVLLRRTKVPMMPVMSEEEFEDILKLDGEEMDLKQLARSFPTGPVRIEKHGDFHFLFRKSEGPREATDVLAHGADTLAEMNAIMLAGNPAFRPPTICGISQKLPDGSFRTIKNLTVKIQSRSAMIANPRSQVYRTGRKGHREQRANRGSDRTQTCGQTRTSSTGADHLWQVEARLGKLVQGARCHTGWQWWLIRSKGQKLCTS